MNTCDSNKNYFAAKFSRRTLLGFLVSSALLKLPRVNAQTPKMPTRAYASLSALADTIVPRDEYPGAVDAGVPQQIVDSLSKDEGKRAKYRRGLELADGLAKRDHGTTFVNLDLEARERLVDSLATGDLFSRQFQYLLINDVMRFYYSSRAGQQMLYYQPPANGYPSSSAPCA